MKLSIVTTMYQSAGYLEAFHARASRAAEALYAEVEFVYVNDGSPDDSLAKALELQGRDERIVVVDLSRNFGHHKAIMTGLAHATGERVFLIDCDLEEDPAWLAGFHTRLAEGADVAYGVQAARKGGLFERLSGRLFHRVLDYVSDHSLPHDVVTARLMTRRYVDSLLEFRERELFLAGIWFLTGYRQTPLTVTKGSKGTSTYDLRRKLAITVNALTSFGDKPLYLIFYAGCLISLLASSLITYLIVRKLVFGITVEGWASVMVSVWFIGGVQMMVLGVLAIYLSKVFVETKQRPYTVVREVFRAKAGRAP